MFFITDMNLNGGILRWETCCFLTFPQFFVLILRALLEHLLLEYFPVPYNTPKLPLKGSRNCENPYPYQLKK